MCQFFGYVKSPISPTLFYKRFQGRLHFLGFNGNSIVTVQYSPTVPSYVQYHSYGRCDILAGTRVSKLQEELNNFIAWSSIDPDSVTPDNSDPTAYTLTDPTKFVIGTVLLRDTAQITNELLKSVLASEVKMIHKHAVVLNYEK